MNILEFIASLLVAITATITGLFAGGQVPTQESVQQLAPIVEEIDVASQATLVATAVEATSTPKTSQNSVLDAYELGKEVGRLEGHLEAIETMLEAKSTAEHEAQVSVTMGQQPAPQSTMPEPVSLAKIEIISPVPSKGLGRVYKTSGEYDDRGEAYNELYIGAIVYNEAGKPTKDLTVTITATDETQNSVVNGTGNTTALVTQGSSTQVPFYKFNYQFKTLGEHTITFEAIGLTKSVTVNVTE